MALLIEVSPEMEAFIKSEVESGRFSSVSEVVGEALKRMREDKERAQAFRDAVQIGLDQLERGEAISWTPESMDEIIEEAIREGEAELERGEVVPYTPELRKMAISTALKALQAESLPSPREVQEHALRAAIQKGLDDIERGDTIPYTRETLKLISEAAIKNMHGGKPRDPDVLS